MNDIYKRFYEEEETSENESALFFADLPNFSSTCVFPRFLIVKVNEECDF